MSENKNQTIQIMRGLAIAIVLLRHAIAQVNTDAVLDMAEQIIICFHMPVFFVLAGYLFQNRIEKDQAIGGANFCWEKPNIFCFLMPSGRFFFG